ncbi:MAG: class I SAM-dependent methyltransferase [Bacteroidota bacterium]
MSHAIFENSRAHNYDQFVIDWIPNYQYFMNLLPALLQGKPEEAILVAGCGTGNEISRIVKQDPDRQITGIDPSPEMLDQAREKLDQYPQVQLIDGYLKDLPQGPKFSFATLLLVLHFLEDDGSKLDLLKQIANRLDPGGKLVLLDITGNREQIQDNLQILKSMIPAEIEQNEVSERLDKIENELYYVSEERLVELLVSAGFESPTRFFQSSIYMGWVAKKAAI